MKRAIVIIATALASAATSLAQPSPPIDPPAPGSGSGPGGSAADPPVDPAPPQPPGSGSAPGPGSAGSGSGSGSGTGPRIIQVPTDINAPQVTASVGPTEVKLGDQFTLYVRATYAAGVVVNLQEPLDLGPAFEITKKDSQDEGQPDGRTMREWQIRVIAWELGDLIVPPVAVTYTSGGKALQIQTNASKLRVIGVLGDVVDDPKAMRGNAAPNDILVRDWFWLYVAIGVTAGLVIMISLLLFLRGRRRRVELVGGTLVSGPRKFDTPASRALAKLLAIETSGVLDREDDRKQGYADMVDIIREYLGTRYRVATYDLTTYELMRKLAGVAPDDEKRMIERWLESCDIVKYGGLKATAYDGKRTLDAARELVLTTSQPAKPGTALAKPPAGDDDDPTTKVDKVEPAEVEAAPPPASHDEIPSSEAPRP